MSRTRILAGLLVVIVVLAAVFGYYSLSKPQLSILVSASSSVATAGSPITLTVIPSLQSASVSSVAWNFGDGVNQTNSGSSTTHTFANGGHYLVLAQAAVTYQNFLFPNSAVASNSMALFPLTVQPTLTQDQAQETSVPTISFPSASNPTAPVFNAGDTVHPVGGFLEAPANSNWTISGYAWDFGNGNNQTVSASSDGTPVENVSATYSEPGLYPLSLTLTTGSNGATFSVTTMYTIAVQSNSLPFALLTTSSGARNPGVITVAEVQPGGPHSWDPQIEYEVVGGEELYNVFQTLVQYNGSSTFTFIPYLAATLPTQQNGGISPDYKTYTFQIRSDQYFSNGDPVTAYDVWFSVLRDMAFTNGSPGTPGWIQAQFLIAGAQNGTASIYTNNTWSAVTAGVTYDNASNTVTFHYNQLMQPSLVFQILANPEGVGIVDARYAWSVGAGFNEANWNSYQNQANSVAYNTQMEWDPIGSGPYMIQAYTPGQSVELVPNPHYGGVPGIPKQTTTVVIDWVKTPDTALLMLEDGEADSVTYLPPSDFPAIQKLQSEGLVNVYNFPTLSLNFYPFNIQIDKELETSQFGTGFNEPSNYFADLPTRLAWVNAFDYSGFLNNILGNAKYGASFGNGFQGVIPDGMIYYVPPDQLGGLPTQNLNAARGNFSISAFAKQQITIPVIVISGDLVDLASAEEWAGTLAQISNGNINAKVVVIPPNQETGLRAQGADPMPVSVTYWVPDYPDPTDYMPSMYAEGGYYPSGGNWGVSNFASLPPPTPYDVVHINGTTFTQSQVYSWINGNITLGDTSVNPAVRQEAYATATKLAIDMGLYVYTYQARQFWFFRSWLKGYEMEENPMIGGAGEHVFYWLTKE